MNRKSRINDRFTRGGPGDIGNGVYEWEYPAHLRDEYMSEYNCTPTEYYAIVLDEIDSCRIEYYDKKTAYKLWFGKYKNELLHEMEDITYLNYLCEVFRNKNKNLVGQVLLRLDDLGASYEV